MHAFVLPKQVCFNGGKVLSSSVRPESHILEAAIRLGRSDVVTYTISNSVEQRRVALIKSFGAEGRSNESILVFQSCPENMVCLYNALIDACEHRRNLDAAERVMSDAIKAGLTDGISYNASIKIRL